MARDSADWGKRSYSSANGGRCVEVGNTSARVVVRDTNDRAGASLAFSPDAWQRFAATIKDSDRA